MSWRLKSHIEYCPGCFSYRETIEGQEIVIGGSDSIDVQASKLARIRAANHWPRSSFAEALEDMDSYHCRRLGNNPQWCVETDIPFDQWAPALRARSGGGCGGCGTPANHAP